MDWIDEYTCNEKPNLTWIDHYTKNDGTLVDGHFRTEPNETVADNLGTDLDRDGIPGWVDSDADGDGILDACDLDIIGIADFLSSILG